MLINLLSLVATAVALLTLLGVPFTSPKHTAGSEPLDPEDSVVLVRPVDSETSGSGAFSYLSAAVDSYPYTRAIGDLAVACYSTCLTEFEKVSVWQGFADGFEGLELRIRWDAIGGLSLYNGRTALATFLIEYDIGEGWQLGQEDIWDSEIPTCSEFHPAACSSNVLTVPITNANSSALIRVRATVKLKMTSCGLCDAGDASHMTVTMAVRDIQVLARAPVLRAEPNGPVVRGDSVTFRVSRAPVTTYSNWRFEFVPYVHPTIVRTENINTSTWVGPLLLSGKARVQVIVPGNAVSIPLDASITVTPRDWNSAPKSPPVKVTGITPGGIPSPPEPLPRLMGYALIDADFLWDGQAVPDGPNKGLSYVLWVRHDDVPGTRVEYEISADVEPGKTFYEKQCGAGGFISGAVLRANGYEHESGTTRGHYQQYSSKLADPAVNFAKWAEGQTGSVTAGFGSFSTTIFNGLTNRKGQINSAASAEACNNDWRYDVNCSFRGNINFPPYQAPCQ